MYQRTVCKNIILPGFTISCVLLFFFSCSQEESTVTPCSTLVADDTLKRAEAKLESAGIMLSFDEPGELMHPENLMPDPDDLASVDKQKTFEEVIDQLNTVLAEIEREAQADVSCSVSDQALLHLYLGFVYLFDATSRLLISDDPAETFIMEFDPDAPDGQWYTLDVSPATHAKLDATEDPLDYPLVFTAKERQAIIDAADLIDDAIVKPRAAEIQPRLSSVDLPPYSNYALWHFDKAASLFSEYQPEVTSAMKDFNESIHDMRSTLQDGAEGWGFVYVFPPWRQTTGTHAQ